MRIAHTVPLTILALALVACSAEVPVKESPTDAPAQPADEPATAGPAGEVAPDSRAPAEPETADAAAPAMPEGLSEEWAPYFAHVPFVFGSEAGLAKAAETGRPMMMFYAATW